MRRADWSHGEEKVGLPAPRRYGRRLRIPWPEPIRMSTASMKAPAMTWRTPAVIVICGCLIAVLTFGLRSSLGFFMTPVSLDNSWGRDVFAFSIALQNLLWG